jgi:hypothetical protein
MGVADPDNASKRESQGLEKGAIGSRYGVDSLSNDESHRIRIVEVRLL